MVELTQLLVLVGQLLSRLLELGGTTEQLRRSKPRVAHELLDRDAGDRSDCPQHDREAPLRGGVFGSADQLDRERARTENDDQPEEQLGSAAEDRKPEERQQKQAAEA